MPETSGASYTSPEGGVLQSFGNASTLTCVEFPTGTGVPPVPFVHVTGSVPVAGCFVSGTVARSVSVTLSTKYAYKQGVCAASRTAIALMLLPPAWFWSDTRAWALIAGVLVKGGGEK